MRMDQLYQFLVPLSFLAIWALTSLFNRDAQSLPPRAARQTGPFGPRSSQDTLTANENPWRPDPDRREPKQAPQNRSQRPRPTLQPDDGIVILDPDGPMSRSTRTSGAGRRPAKGRAAAQALSKKKEHPKQQHLSLPANIPLSSPINTTTALVPLSLIAAETIAQTTSVDTSRIESPRTRPVERLAVSIEEIHALLRSPSRVGEAIIINELLAPPYALRGRRTFRR